MIIGIIGKIGHGKDTVANFIRRNSDTIYTVRRFADPIKSCVAEILNCSVMDLEDRAFKERPIGPEWLSYRTQFDQWMPERIYRSKEERSDDFKKIGWDVEDVTFTEVQMTPRIMLQTLGTEWGRNMIHPDIWVNSMMSLYEQSRVNGPKGNYPDWLMPDVRFSNEAQAIKDRGGILIKVINPRVSSDSLHASEAEVDTIEADLTIINDGTLQHLESLTQKAMKELGI